MLSQLSFYKRLDTFSEALLKLYELCHYQHYPARLMEFATELRDAPELDLVTIAVIIVVTIGVIIVAIIVIKIVITIVVIVRIAISVSSSSTRRTCSGSLLSSSAGWLAGGADSQHCWNNIHRH